MSLQADIEAELETLLLASIPGVVVYKGPIGGPEVEGATRVASVRRISGDGTRIEFGQTEWSEAFSLTVHWSMTISRDVAITEWEAFATALLAEHTLNDNVQGLTDAWLSATAWSEPIDSSIRTMAADINIQRVD